MKVSLVWIFSDLQPNVIFISMQGIKYKSEKLGQTPQLVWEKTTTLFSVHYE